MFDNAQIAIRSSQREACHRAWERLGQPGTWWTGLERVAMIRAMRAARSCRLCQRRKTTIAPMSVAGAHTPTAPLPSAAIEAIHRLATDPGRLTESWYHDVLASGLSPHQYVELTGVVAMAAVVSTFARAIGASDPPAPAIEPGDPSRLEPASASLCMAWVPTLAQNRLTPELAALYGSIRSTLPTDVLARRGADRVGNVMLALSLVPDEQYAFSRFSSAALYRSGELSLSDDQRELVASTTSAYNDCFY